MKAAELGIRLQDPSSVDELDMDEMIQMLDQAQGAG